MPIGQIINPETTIKTPLTKNPLVPANPLTKPITPTRTPTSPTPTNNNPQISIQLVITKINLNTNNNKITRKNRIIK